MDGLVPPPVVDGRFQLEDKSNNAEGPNSNVKRPAPKAGGCRLEGFVRVKKVQTLPCYFLNLNNQLFPFWLRFLTLFLRFHPQCFWKLKLSRKI
jgi:hypothetical protein